MWPGEENRFDRNSNDGGCSRQTFKVASSDFLATWYSWSCEDPDLLQMNKIWQTWWKIISEILLQKIVTSVSLAHSLSLSFGLLTLVKPAAMLWAVPMDRSLRQGTEGSLWPMACAGLNPPPVSALGLEPPVVKCWDDCSPGGLLGCHL